ncbi:Fur family transcriptional regulator [Teredinibacter turnerae]|uniref:Fur family transcriptional regulator n=1 Tax=Teredinibacter turnerae TaxID=2426 RepID=UPI00037945C3|nr:Fur family transcriptional regulator [Teredinibacter turnerae]
MPDIDVNRILTRADQLCSGAGVRLTEKRKRILELLVESGAPLSAYEVAEAYNRSTETSMPAMSVYRILDFLASEQLVHKLASHNKYIACAHIACDHPHQIPQFLICRNCKAVKEIGIEKSLVDNLSRQVSKAGYTLLDSPLELDCLCANCS